MGLYENIQESIDHIRRRLDIPSGEDDSLMGLVLGTGLGGITQKLSITHRIPFEEIPHFRLPTVDSHAGELLFAKLNDKKLLVLSGRLHFYEGHTASEITYPIRVLKFLGISHLLITNVAGSTNPAYEAGDFVFIRDHINLQHDHPLRGPNDERIGPRFPDMSEPYDPSGLEKLRKIALDMDIRHHRGVYACLQGPNLETPAEYEYIHRIGADLVGMSTVPEVIVARHMNLPVNVISLVSNACYPPERIKETTLETVLDLVRNREPQFIELVMRFIREFSY